jgi:hypothetical protein
MLLSGACGKVIHEKNLKRKISWHSPFKVGHKDSIGDNNSGSETGLDIKKATRTKVLHIFLFWENVWRNLFENHKKQNDNKLIQVECLPSKISTYVDI